MRDNSSNPIIADCEELFVNAGFLKDQVDLFTQKAIGVLNDYADRLGEGTEVRYKIAKTLFRYMLYVFIPGESYNPLTSGNSAKEYAFNSVLSLNLNTANIRISHKYALNRNIIAVGIPLSERKKKFFKDPIFIAVISGILCGLICQRLPTAANGFIVDKIASPLMSLILKLMAGIMGPVIFISMTSSIVALDDINELTNLGFKIIKRLILSTLFMMLVSIIVSEAFFRHVANRNVSFSYDKIIDMIFDLVPINLIQPFLDNKIPQLVILGVILGIGLLLLGDKVTELKKIIVQLDEWTMSTMRIILLVVPAIPFLSIMTAIAGGKGADLLKGWKFVAAVYIVFTVCVATKAVKTSLVTHTGICEYWKKMKPVIMLSLTTGSTTAPLKKQYEVSENELSIKPEFNSFWIPMCSAMLSPKTTINVVVATFMMAQITGVQVSESFLIVLIIMTLQLSLASPGTTSAWTIMFDTLALGTGYVGLFTAYRLLTENYTAAGTEAYCMLEEIEAAHKLGGIKGA